MATIQKRPRARQPFETTSVPIERTKDTLRKLLSAWGAEGVDLHEYESRRLVVVEFQIPIEPGEDAGEEREFWLKIRMTFPLPHPGEEAFHKYFSPSGIPKRRSDAAAGEKYLQEVRRRWRCFYAAIRQKLINIDTGISDELDEWEPFVVIPQSDKTWREHTRQPLRQALAGGAVAWLQALPARVQEGGGE